MFNPAPTNRLTEERFHDEAYARVAWRTNCFNGSGLGPQAGRLFRNKRAAGASWPSGSSCLASCYSLPSRPSRSCCARQPRLRAPPMCPQESTLKWSLQVEISLSPFPSLRACGDERKRWPKICASDTRRPKPGRQTDSDRRIRRKRRDSSSRHRRSGRANCSRTSRSGHGVCHRPVRDLLPPTERRYADNGCGNCCRNKKTFHDDNRA
jgi:hypothetical protein